MRYLAIDYGNKRTGLAICDPNETIVSHNRVLNSGSHGIVIASDLGEDMAFVKVLNNIITNCNEENSGTISGIHVNSLVAATNMDFIDIRGNVVYDSRSPKQTAYGVRVDYYQDLRKLKKGLYTAILGSKVFVQLTIS